MQQDNMNLPEWLWHKEFECVVRVMQAGHFPGTVMIKLPDDRIVETDANQLELPR
jgi:hypothetical protein